MIALSTAWFGKDRPTVEETIRQGAAAGFAAFEIGAWGSVPPAGTLVALADELSITYTSVHNVAYREGLAEEEVFGDGLSSSDKTTRERAVDATVRTVELARAIGARCAVIHAGIVEVENARQKQVGARKLYKAGRREEAREMMAAFMVERNRLAPRAVETTAGSLAEVFRRVGDFPLALESRINYDGIPQPGELAFVMGGLRERPVYYWHDVGHTVISEMLGLAGALSWLDTFGKRLFGMHLHDVKKAHDHGIPGTGEVDFAALAPYVTDDVLKVMEIPGTYSAGQLQAGRAHLEACGIA